MWHGLCITFTWSHSAAVWSRPFLPTSMPPKYHGTNASNKGSQHEVSLAGISTCVGCYWRRNARRVGNLYTAEPSSPIDLLYEPRMERAAAPGIGPFNLSFLETRSFYTAIISPIPKNLHEDKLSDDKATNSHWCTSAALWLNVQHDLECRFFPKRLANRSPPLYS